MRKFFIITLILVFIMNGRTLAVFAEEINYDDIYNKLPSIDFAYEHNEDPDEVTDYENYVGSPYPLIRISLKLYSKNGRLSQGYYLMTPRNRNGYDFVMFKQNGRIAALVPIYEKKLIIPDFVYPKEEKKKENLLQKTGNTVKNMMMSPFKSKTKPPPPARYAISGEIVDNGKYFDLWLYREEYLYKMLFKIDTKK